MVLQAFLLSQSSLIRNFLQNHDSHLDSTKNIPGTREDIDENGFSIIIADMSFNGVMAAILRATAQPIDCP